MGQLNLQFSLCFWVPGIQVSSQERDASLAPVREADNPSWSVGKWEMTARVGVGSMSREDSATNPTKGDMGQMLPGHKYEPGGRIWD